MKNRVCILLYLVAVLAVALCVFTACNTTIQSVKFKITFDVDGTSYYEINTQGAEVLQMPTNPIKDDYIFDGWYWDKDTWTRPFTANSLLNEPLNADMRVYAKWERDCNHNAVVDKGYVATCTKDGLTDGSHCSKCNDVLVAQEAIKATGHSIEQVKAQVPTCTGVGWNAYEYCTKCDYTTKVEIKANGHDIKQANAKAATCTEIGWNAYEYCANCDYSTKTEIKATGHSFKTEWATDASCHWHVADCEHNVTTERIAHTFDADWKCTVCKYQDVALHGTELRAGTFAIDGTDLYTKVSNDTTTFSFIKEIRVADGAIFTVHTDMSCSGVSEIRSKTAPLEIGDNVLYILVSNGNDVGLYTATIRRRPIYEVTFDTAGGTAVESQQVEEDDFATEPTTTRKGYAFDSWDYDFAQPITDDTMVAASWNIITYNITYDLNDTGFAYSAVNNTLNPTTYTVEDSITFANPTCTGYTFNGWDTISIAKGTIGDKKITAKDWSIITYSISYNNNVASTSVSKTVTNSNPTTYTVEDAITFAPASRSGYDFVAWDRNIERGTTGEITITASWKIKVYNINYVINGGTNSSTNMNTYTVEDGTIIFDDALSDELFCGWYENNSNGAYVSEISSTIVKDITLCALFDGTSGLVISNGIVTGYVGKSCSVNIPRKYRGIYVTGIGNYAFRNCDVLMSLTIPSGVTSIGISAFSSCDELISITVESGNTKYHSANNCIIETEAKTLISGCKTSVIPTDGSVTSVGDSAFYGCNGLTGLIIPDSVTSIGNSAFEYCGSLTNVIIPNNVTVIKQKVFSNCSSLQSIVIGDNVTNIGQEAFYNCSSLTSITIPQSVTFIGNRVFNNCTSLSTVNWNAIACESAGNESPNVTSFRPVFSGCTNLTAVNIGSQVEIISDYVFFDCSGLANITLGNSVTKIGRYAFYNCKELVDVTLGNSLTSIDKYAFYGCKKLKSITIPQSITAIGGYAFYRCTGLINLSILDSTTYIGNNAFYQCSSMTEVNLGNNITQIGDSAFSGCNGIKSISIPDSVKSIGNNAFTNCSGLSSLIIPSSVTRISWDILHGCSGLTEITFSFTWTYNGSGFKSLGYFFGGSYSGAKEIKQSFTYGNANYSATYYIPESLKSVTITGDIIPPASFMNFGVLTNVTISDGITKINDYAFSGCSGLTSVEIADSVEYISNYAFKGCSRLANIVIPDGVTYVGDYAFSNCNVASSADLGLKSVTMGKGVTHIGDYAFYDCQKLENITLSENLTEIGQYAFKWCVRLSEIIIPDSMTTIGGYAFADCTGLTNITIPNSVTKISSNAFSGCVRLANITIPDSVTWIGAGAFSGCSNLTSIKFNNSSGWYRTTSFLDWNNETNGTSTSVANASTNVTYFTNTYVSYYWYREQ